MMCETVASKDLNTPLNDDSIVTGETQCSDCSIEIDPSPSRVRSVSFSTCEIHSFKMVLGDNPGVHVGLPIQLGPKVEKSRVVDVDTYERHREGKRKTGHDLCISFYDRLRMLRMSGYSDDELATRLNEVERAKKKRESSSRGLAIKKRLEKILHRHSSSNPKT